jgi:hypothetical protein
MIGGVAARAAMLPALGAIARVRGYPERRPWDEPNFGPN